MESRKPNSIDWTRYWDVSSTENGYSQKRFLSLGELPSDQRIEAERLLWARINFSELIVKFPIIKNPDNPLNRQREIKYTNGGKRINLCFGSTNEIDYWIGVEGKEEDIFFVSDVKGRSFEKLQKEVPSTILAIIEEVNYWGE